MADLETALKVAGRGPARGPADSGRAGR